MAEVVKRSWRVALVYGSNETTVDGADSATSAVVAIHGPVLLELWAGRRVVSSDGFGWEHVSVGDG